MNARHWSNNCAGLFLVTVVLFAITIGINRHAPSGAYGALLWLFGLVGLASLGGWIWLSVQHGQALAERVLFGRR